MSYAADLKLALELADIADAVALERFRALDLKVETKPDASPVTDADRATERAIKARLAEARPGDAIIGEEFGSEGAASRTWIIDPIDGTANYMRGVPIWASLISLVVDGKPVVGVVSAPALGRRWWAAAGQGAYTRDIDGSQRLIQVSNIADLEHASISYNNLRLWDESGKLPQLIELSRRLWRTRAYGDFYSYMLLAEGTLEIVAEHGLQIYDIAALVPIVEEAGGKLTDLSGDLSATTSSTLATNGKLHELAQKAFETS